jgi:hypothetical protein
MTEQSMIWQITHYVSSILLTCGTLNAKTFQTKISTEG